MRNQKDLLHPFTGDGKTASSDTFMREVPATAVRISSLFISARPEGLKGFFSLLQEGFLCEMDPRKGVFHFLKERLGIQDPQDMASIGSIYLNEDLTNDEASRGRNNKEGGKGHPSLAFIKLLDTGLDDRCASILWKGILIESDTVDAFFADRKEFLHEMIEKMNLSGMEEDPGLLLRYRLKDLCDLVHLVVRVHHHDSSGFPGK